MARGGTKDQAANAGQGRFPWDIEVALSGGGFRASAFSLGALLYLVDSGLNTRVLNITSVSGGSITNGYVACHCDYASKTTDIETFKAIAGRIARHIAFDGMWRSPLVLLYLVVVGALLLTILMIVAGAILSCLGAFPTPASELMAGLIIAGVLNHLALSSLVGVWLLVLACFVLAYFRGAPVAWWMERTFFGFRQRRITLANLPQRTVDHVFCATDLNNSLPIFFSTGGGGRVLTRAYGMADLRSLSVARAVRASAAFPPAFPPVSLRLPREWTHTSRSSLRNSQAQPRSVWLTDGGPYNNLGTDWSGLRHHIFRLTSYRDNEGGVRSGDIQLVIDASQPDPRAKLWLLHVPVFAICAYLARVMKIMYGSTLSARTEDAVDVAKEQMINNPDRWRLPDRTRVDGPPSIWPLMLVAPCASLPEGVARAWERPRLLGGVFGQRARKYVSEMKEAKGVLGNLWPDGKRVRTTLGSLGRETTLRLIVHGYLMTREVLTVALGPHQPPPVQNASWFEELIPHRRRNWHVWRRARH
jgi:predicted acylesterase/phospholipase RssA